MNKKGRLTLNRETLRNLEGHSMQGVAGGTFSDWQPLCAPSAVKSACMTYCPNFTCTRPVHQAPIEPH